METETMDKLYLELSQFTQAKTHRELRLEAENAKLREAITTHNTECDELCPNDCVYRTTYPKVKCPNCPKDWKIDLPLEDK